MTKRLVFVAIEEGRVIGKASLEGNTVRSVFVVPSRQDSGVGKSLMNHVEQIAKARSIHCLTVSSSVTAEGFYRRLGFVARRDQWYGEERTIIMRKHL